MTTWVVGTITANGSSATRRICWVTPGVRFQKASAMSTVALNAKPAWAVWTGPERPFVVEPGTRDSAGVSTRRRVGLLASRSKPAETPLVGSASVPPPPSTAVSTRVPAVRRSALGTDAAPEFIAKVPTAGANGSSAVTTMEGLVTVLTTL